MKRLISFAIFLVIGQFFTGCGGVSPTTPTIPPITFEELNSKTDVAVDSSFKKNFDNAIDTNTVTGSTFFIQQGISSTDCGSGTVATSTADITCASSTECTIDPATDLTAGRNYSACATTGITEPDGTLITADRADFETAADQITLNDAAGTTIASTGTTGVNPTALRLMFPEDMNVNTVTTANNIMLLHDNFVPTITVAQVGTSQKTFSITVDDAWIYALLSSTLTSAQPLYTAAGTLVTFTYQYDNGCAVGDDFNADMGSCYTNWSTDPLLANFLSFDTTAGELVYDSTNQTADNYLLKFFTVASGFTIELYFDSATGIDDSNSEEVAIQLLNTDTDNAITFGLQGGATDGIQYCILRYEDANTAPATDILAANVCNTGTAYRVKLSVSDAGVVTAESRIDGNAAVALTPSQSIPDISDFSEWVNFFINFNNNAASADNRVQIDKYVTTGVTSTTQY